MKATHDYDVFGPRSDPRTDVPLPAIITAGNVFEEYTA